MSLHDFRQQKTWSPGQGSKALQFFLSVTFWAFGAESTQAGSQHSPGSEQELMQSRQGTNLADSHTDFYPKDSHTMPALPGTGILWTAHREAQLCSQGPARWAHKLQIKCLNGGIYALLTDRARTESTQGTTMKNPPDKKQTEGSEYKSTKYSAIVPVVVKADFSTLITGFCM